MAEDWWYIAHTPDGVHVWDLPDEQIGERAAGYREVRQAWTEQEAIATARGDYATACMAELGFGDEWWSVEGWASMLSPGEPHPSLMAKATVHEQLPQLPPVT